MHYHIGKIWTQMQPSVSISHISKHVLRITAKSRLMIFGKATPSTKSTITPVAGTIQFLIHHDVIVQIPGSLIPYLLLDVLHDDVTLEIVA